MKASYFKWSLHCLSVMLTSAALKHNGGSAAALISGAGSMSDQVESINDRFQNGEPSNLIEKAGVTVRNFDDSTDVNLVWPDFPTAGRIPPWFSKPPLEDRLSASIINKRMPYTYSGMAWTVTHVGAGGFVISPQAAKASMRCGFEEDNSSDNMDKDGAIVPGCIGSFRKHTKSNGWCNAANMNNAWPKCAWPPTSLQTMMTRHEAKVASYLKKNPKSDCAKSCCVYPACPLYNEVILNHAAFKNYLPGAIEAVYFVASNASRGVPWSTDGERVARGTQWKYQQMFGRQIPLMRVNDWHAPRPFELVTEPWTGPGKAFR